MNYKIFNSILNIEKFKIQHLDFKDIIQLNKEEFFNIRIY